MAYLRSKTGNLAGESRAVLSRLGKSLGVKLGLPEIPLVRLGSALDDVDELVMGGLPKGRVSEILGASSSGKASLAWRFVAGATSGGEIAAVVDCTGSFNPAFAKSAGVVLERLLLVFPSTVRQGIRCAEDILAGGGFSIVVLDLGLVPPFGTNTSTWARLARLAEQSCSVFLLLTSESLARSFAVVSLRLRRLRTYWSFQVGRKRNCFARLFEGVAVEVGVARNKLGPSGSRTLVQFMVGEAAEFVSASRGSETIDIGEKRATAAR